MSNHLANELRTVLTGSNVPAATAVRVLMGVLIETAANSCDGDIDLALKLVDQAIASMSTELRHAHQELLITLAGGRN